MALEYRVIYRVEGDEQDRVSPAFQSIEEANAHLDYLGTTWTGLETPRLQSRDCPEWEDV